MGGRKSPISQGQGYVFQRNNGTAFPALTVWDTFRDGSKRLEVSDPVAGPHPRVLIAPHPTSAAVPPGLER